MKNDSTHSVRKYNLSDLTMSSQASSRSDLPSEAAPSATFDPKRYEPEPSQPLAGLTILVTRPAEQAASLCALLEPLGARTLIQPTIRIEPPNDMAPLRSAIQRCHDMIDSEMTSASMIENETHVLWLLFASANGVQSWCETWNSLCHDSLDALRQLQRSECVKIAAIGTGTATALETYYLTIDRVPEKAESGSFAEAFEKEAREGTTFWLVRADRGRDVLPNQLIAWGGRVTQIVAYHSEDVTTPEPGVPANLDGIDWVTVTSSAIAKNLIRMFGDHLHKVRLASISPVTSDVLRRAGFEPATEASAYTMPGIVDAIVAGGTISGDNATGNIGNTGW